MECAKPQAATKLVSQAGKNVSRKTRKPVQLKAFSFQNYQYNAKFDKINQSINQSINQDFNTS